MSCIGYARVSTDDQTTRQQIDALRAAGCAQIFEDTISGASTQRDGLDACLAALKPVSIDWRHDQPAAPSTGILVDRQ